MLRKNKNWILIIGMLITSFGGMVGENWGVSNQYWEYHKVSNKLPLWLPFAWMLAFYFLYSLEFKLISFLKNKTPLVRSCLGLLISLNCAIYYSFSLLFLAWSELQLGLYLNC